MTDYRHDSHTVFSIHRHIVWVTKYGRKVLTGEVANRVRDIVRDEWGYFTRSSGNETDKVIKAYASTALSTSIENQAHDSGDDFHIDGE